MESTATQDTVRRRPRSSPDPSCVVRKAALMDVAELLEKSGYSALVWAAALHTRCSPVKVVT
jgi:hypothetical protein